MRPVSLYCGQLALLEELVEAWRHEREVASRAQAIREEIGRLLEFVQRSGVPPHRVACAYLRAYGRPAIPSEMQRALALVRKRRQRSRRRDPAS